MLKIYARCSKCGKTKVFYGETSYDLADIVDRFGWHDKPSATGNGITWTCSVCYNDKDDFQMHEYDHKENG